MAWVPASQIGKNVKGVKAAVVQGGSKPRMLGHRHGSDADYVAAAIMNGLGVKRGRGRPKRQD